MQLVRAQVVGIVVLLLTRLHKMKGNGFLRNSQLALVCRSRDPQSLCCDTVHVQSGVISASTNPPPPPNALSIFAESLLHTFFEWICLTLCVLSTPHVIWVLVTDVSDTICQQQVEFCCSFVSRHRGRICVIFVPQHILFYSLESSAVSHGN